MSFDPWVRKIPWSQKWHLAPIFLPGKFHGQRSVTGDSPWDCKELDMTEWLSIYITVWEQLIHGFSSVVSTQYSKTFRFLLKLLLGSLDPPAISRAQSYFSSWVTHLSHPVALGYFSLPTPLPTQHSWGHLAETSVVHTFSWLALSPYLCPEYSFTLPLPSKPLLCRTCCPPRYSKSYQVQCELLAFWIASSVSMMKLLICFLICTKRVLWDTFLKFSASGQPVIFCTHIMLDY